MEICTNPETTVAFSRIALGIILCVAGLSKLVSSSLFDALRMVLHSFGISRALGRLLIFSEIALGAWLISGRHETAAGILAALMLLGFLCGLVVLMRRGYAGSCGCFLGARDSVGRSDLLRNLCLMLVATVVAIFSGPNLCATSRLAISEASLWMMAGAVTGFAISVSAFLSEVRVLTTQTRGSD